MALRLVVAPLAERDLADIATFISQDSDAAALKVLTRIESVANLLARRPFLGPIVSKPKRQGLRKMVVAPYVIFYRIAAEELQIVRVLHSSRDIGEEFFAP